MRVNDSKKRVQFVNEQEDSNSLPMKEKKLVSFDGNNDNNLKPLEKKLNEQNGIQFEKMNQVIRYDFKDEMDRLLSAIDQRQSIRLQKFQGLIKQQNKENNDIITQLRELKEANLKQQQQIIEFQNQEEQQYQKQSRQSNLNSQMGENKLNYSMQYQLEGYNNNTNMNKYRSSILKKRNSTFEDENINSQNINNKMIQEQSFNERRLTNNMYQSQSKYLVNEQTIKECLETIGVYNNPKSTLQVSFFKKKVKNYDEELVDGYYFKIIKYNQINFEFYFYQIDNINEIEYNPIIISNQEVLQTEENNSQLNDFYSILSFPVSMLLGFFENFFNFVLLE